MAIVDARSKITGSWLKKHEFLTKNEVLKAFYPRFFFILTTSSLKNIFLLVYKDCLIDNRVAIDYPSSKITGSWLKNMNF